MTSKKTTREQKEQIQLGSAYWGLKVLLDHGSEPEEELLRFHPEHLKRWPQATRAAIEGSDSWYLPYVDRLVSRGLVERDGQGNVKVRDREGILALLKTHDEGGVELSDLVFKKSSAPDLAERSEPESPAPEGRDPVQVLTEIAERLVDYMELANGTDKQILEGVQSLTKRVSVLERQLGEMLGGLNGAIRVMQEVDAAKFASSLTVVARAQGELRNAVFERFELFDGEIRAVRSFVSEISAGLKAREENKLDRALSDLQSGLDLLVEARGQKDA